jgi:hypothetical protein
MTGTEFMREHTPDTLRAQTITYTKQNYSKGFEPFNFLHVTLYRILKVNKYIQRTEAGFFCMRSILKMFVEREVICKWDL